MGTTTDDDDATDDGRSAVVDSFSLPFLSELVLICITCSQQQSMIIGASLSEPHIDWHNGPRGGECFYQSICHGVAFVLFNVPEK